MKPIGLTMKNGRNKYRLDQRGELMLIHQCVECGSLSINRIAADDDPSKIVVIFQESTRKEIRMFCGSHGILALQAGDSDALYKQLYGGREISVEGW
jgi:hypothetical protein